jgi:hypothetical protein
MYGGATFASPVNTTSVPLKPGSRGPTKGLKSGRFTIPRYPAADYSKIKPKVNTNLRNLKKDEEVKTVSCAVTCSVVQMEERNSPVTG